MFGAPLIGAPSPVPGRTALRYELRSAEQLDALARAPLPSGFSAGAPRRSMHRDLFLDTADESLRRRGVTCRLRLGAADRQLLSLRIDASAGEPAVRVDARVRSADVQAALAENNSVTRRVRALVDPAALETHVVLEVDRLTRMANPDFLRRPRLELHFDQLSVRRDGAVQQFHRMCVHLLRGSGAELERLAHALEATHDLRQPVSTEREHAEVLLRWKRAETRRPVLHVSDQAHPSQSARAETAPDLLCPELSLLAFQRRVLALAEDHATPLRERLRFLGIVSSNIDELYMVRMAGLRSEALSRGAAERGDDGLTAIERLALVETEVTSILAAQSACARDCLRESEAYGVQVMKWTALSGAEQATLTAYCRDDIHPALTPLAMTLSPGHPLPHLPHHALSLAVVFRRESGDRPHLAEFELPTDVPRLVPVPGRDGALITIEELLRANLDLLHPNTQVDSAHLFRVTRQGDLALDEEGAENLLAAVAEATERRAYNPAVRVEVERTMPAFVAELVLESLRRDASVQDADVAVDHVQVVDGLLDLRCLGDLPLPARAELEYPPLRAGAPVLTDTTVCDVVRERDLLVHHPFDSFDETVLRFLREAAADAAVTTVKITLYRVGSPSPIVEALLEAAHAGKKVVAFVELKARFDEEHNVSWARALEQAGGSVVYGLVGYKTHVKMALVVRREGAKLRQYAHVGTGNYNPRAGRQYTDLSLFSARESLCADVADLFNELTGSSRPPQGLTHGALAAPHQLLPAVLALIGRETSHALAGRASGITIKVNGLSDPEVVRALYAASEAGVPIELVVRGICTLRPGRPGLSSRIRVVSVVGRFLEHSRIYRFVNGGAPEYLIGSSDLRPRNLRRRVELLIPVPGATERALLDAVLALYIGDRTGWELQADGVYRQRESGAPGAQAELMATAAGQP